MINDNENEVKNKNRSHRYSTNRPRPSDRHKYTKHNMYLKMMMVICIKKHLSKILKLNS